MQLKFESYFIAKKEDLLKENVGSKGIASKRIKIYLLTTYFEIFFVVGKNPFELVQMTMLQREKKLVKCWMFFPLIVYS